MKLKWKVDEKPTGKFSSFERRGWPTAEFANGDSAARIECENEYIPSNVRIGQHAPLAVRIACWTQNRTPAQPAFVWRRLTLRFATLQEAKATAESFIEQHPEFRLKEHT